MSKRDEIQDVSTVWAVTEENTLLVGLFCFEDEKICSIHCCLSYLRAPNGLASIQVSEHSTLITRVHQKSQPGVVVSVKKRGQDSSVKAQRLR